MKGDGKMHLVRYCMIPTRLRNVIRTPAEKIVRGYGDAPVIPFNLGPYDDFEGNPNIGRKKTLRIMKDLKNICEADAFFGVSWGTMYEFKDTLDRRDELGIERDIRIHYGLDPEWEKYYKELKQEFGDLFASLRGRHSLIALVGPRAAGKTFLSDHLLQRFNGRLLRVRNTTTRMPRDKEDYSSYNFISDEEFTQRKQEGMFLETDYYQGNHYGSSISEIQWTLKKSCGIFAITAPGAKALFDRRFEINLKIISLVPKSPEVLKQNMETRGITDPKEQKELIKDAEDSVLPKEVDHEIIKITNDTKTNLGAIVEIAKPILCRK